MRDENQTFWISVCREGTEYRAYFKRLDAGREDVVFIAGFVSREAAIQAVHDWASCLKKRQVVGIAERSNS